MKKIKIFVGALLCMNLLTISGCDKVVHSAVVEEKDKTVVKTEENKEKETVQKTVAEQVQAPETYQTTIQSDLRSVRANRSGKSYEIYLDSRCTGGSAGCGCHMSEKCKKSDNF